MIMGVQELVEVYQLSASVTCSHQGGVKVSERCVSGWRGSMVIGEIDIKVLGEV